MSTTETPFQIRTVVIPIYLPTLLFSAGEAAIIPVIPVIAKNLGADLSIAGLVASMLMVGIVCGDVPGGAIVARIGERLSMLWSSVLALIGVGVAVIAPHPSILALGLFLIGLATSVFALARHAFLTTHVPTRYRARALSTLGGMFRGGAVLGPLLTAWLTSIFPDPASAFWLTASFTVATTLVLILMPDPEKRFGRHRPEPTSRVMLHTVSENWRVLLKLGGAAGIVVALRTGRSVLLPLWAVSLGVGSSDTALVFAIASGIDFALFFTSGSVMDRFGRLAAIIPSMLGLSIPLIVLSFTHDWHSAVTWFVIVTLATGFGNGIGSGINLTLASDLAPRSNPAPFLGAFRLTTDIGAATAPLAVSAVIALSSISVASAGLGALGFVGMAMMLRWVPKYVPHHRATRKATRKR